MSRIGDTTTVKPLVFHTKASETIRGWSKSVRRDLGESLLKLQLGISLGLPLSRPMPSVMQGAHELRLKDESGIYRVFYYVKSSRGIFVFHAFTKKDRRTPDFEIGLARKRLKEFMSNE